MLQFAWLSLLVHFQSPQILKVDLWKSNTQIILSYKFSSLNNPLKIPISKLISNFKNSTIYVHLFNYCFHYYYYYYYYYSTYLFIYLFIYYYYYYYYYYHFIYLFLNIPHSNNFQYFNFFII